LATDNDRNEQPMATADGDVETKAYFRKYSIAIKLSLSLAAQQATPVAIYPEGYCCSRATLLSSSRINGILTSFVHFDVLPGRILALYHILMETTPSVT
jgi:hypothetical protein